MDHITTAHKIRMIMDLRQKGIHDTDVLSAMEKIPRELFVPDEFGDKAYDDMALPIARDQTISQPLIVARMTQELQCSDRDKILEIGTGSGYQAAILSKLCRRVYTIERHRPLLRGAKALFDHLRIHNITEMLGDGMKGWPAQAPFDKIIVTAGAVEKPPEALKEQLKIGGILVIPVSKDDNTQILQRYKKEDDDLFAVQDIMPVRFVPLLPNIAQG